MPKGLSTKDKRGIALIILFTLSFLAIFVFLALPKPDACPACDQHYLFIDNSEKIEARDLQKLVFDDSGQGLLNRIWRELEVGDQLNILTFDAETFDSTYLSRGALVKPYDPDDINELVQGSRLIKVEFDAARAKIETVLENLPKDGMGQTKIMAGLYDIGIAIDNHRATYKKSDGSAFKYRIILVSDLLEFSNLYNAYSRSRESFEDWSRGPKFRAGLADLSGVELEVYQVQRGLEFQDESLEMFWAKYFNASGAYPVKAEDF